MYQHLLQRSGGLQIMYVHRSAAMLLALLGAVSSTQEDLYASFSTHAQYQEEDR